MPLCWRSSLKTEKCSSKTANNYLKKIFKKSKWKRSKIANMYGFSMLEKYLTQLTLFNIQRFTVFAQTTLEKSVLRGMNTLELKCTYICSRKNSFFWKIFTIISSFIHTSVKSCVKYMNAWLEIQVIENDSIYSVHLGKHSRMIYTWARNHIC